MIWYCFIKDPLIIAFLNCLMVWILENPGILSYFLDVSKNRLASLKGGSQILPLGKFLSNASYSVRYVNIYLDICSSGIVYMYIWTDMATW